MKTNERRLAQATLRGTNLCTASSLLTGDQGSGRRSIVYIVGKTTTLHLAKEL